MAEATSQGWKEVSGLRIEVQEWTKEKWVDIDSSAGLATLEKSYACRLHLG